MAIKNIDQAEIQGKKVLARFDFNVPLNNGEITDTSRIDRALETIKYIIEQGASKITLMSHLGRPNDKKDEKYSLEPVAKYLASKLGQDVILSESAIDSGVKSYLTLPEVKLVLLENLRFHPEEKANDMNFAQKLSEYGDIYINDAFGVSHREHASVHAINFYFKDQNYAGFIMQKEIEALDKILNQPKKPFVAIVGGAKVADKIKILERLIVSVDKLLIGGAMAYPFLKAQGFTIGKSLCSDEDVRLAKSIIKSDRGGKLVLPNDHICSTSFDGEPETIIQKNIENEKMGLDIGPNTVKEYSEIIAKAKTILWNGPMGLFENAKYANGTFGIATAIAESSAYSLVGGGDSVSAVNKSGDAEKFSHLSTGGGASLEYIEKTSLPGIQALKFGVR